MYCTKCGAPLEDGAKFCTECGEKMEPKDSEEKKEIRQESEVNEAPGIGEESETREETVEAVDKEPSESPVEEQQIYAPQTPPQNPQAPETPPEPRTYSQQTTSTHTTNNVNVNTTGYIVWSIINLVACCLPLGIVGLIFTLQAGKATTQLEAEDALKKAKIFNLIGTITGVVVLFLYIILFFGSMATFNY